MRLRGVTRSAQNTENAPKDHHFWSPLTALKSDWQTLKWDRSTIPFALEL
jgi:hypothetical protein